MTFYWEGVLFSPLFEMVAKSRPFSIRAGYQFLLLDLPSKKNLREIEKGLEELAHYTFWAGDKFPRVDLIDFLEC